jgi:hypothetical protein
MSEGRNRTEEDIGKFLRDIVVGPETERRREVFLGIDECFNRSEIDELATALLRRRLIFTSSPLWYEFRVREGVPTGSFLGGVDKDSLFRGPDSLMDDIGVPVKGWSWCDLRVIQLLVCEFYSYDRLVLLSENMRNDANGLRSLLNQVVAPALKDRGDRLSLTALFKRGKTSISDYVAGVTEFIEQGRTESGYVELRF